MKLKKHIISQKGITLIEMIIVVVIIGIITSSVASVFIFSNKTYTTSKNHSFAQNDIMFASNKIVDELRYAKSLEIVNSLPVQLDDFKYIYFKDNGDLIQIVFKNSKTLIDRKIDDKDSYFEVESGKTLKFKIVDQDSEYHIESSIYLQNIDVSSTESKIGKCIRYK